MSAVPYLILALSFGLATGIIGRAKGSSFFIWLLIGGVLPGLGLIAVILYRPETEEPERRCPRLRQGPQALRPGLQPLRHRPLPARSLRGSASGDGRARAGWVGSGHPCALATKSR